MAKELNMTISETCKECPYCQSKAYFLSNDDWWQVRCECNHAKTYGNRFIVNATDKFPPILVNCPLPNKEGGVGA